MNDAQYMKSVRTKLGIGQTEMAVRLGYGSHKDISRIERGHRNMSNQVRKHLETIENTELNGGK